MNKSSARPINHHPIFYFNYEFKVSGFLIHPSSLIPHPLIQVSSARSRNRIALFVKIHSKIKSHAVEQVFNFRQ